jgi:hypothetical protein
MSRNYFRSGDWNVICDVCGKKMKASSAKHRWDGLIVCNADFEHRHSQDFIRVRQDKITVPFLRPRPEDVFVFVCNPATQSAYVGLATADCSLADTTFGMSYFDLLNSTYCSFSRKTGIAGVGYAGCALPNYNLSAYL